MSTQPANAHELIPFVKLRSYAAGPGRRRWIIRREDGVTETLWSDEVEARETRQFHHNRKRNRTNKKPQS